MGTLRESLRKLWSLLGRRDRLHTLLLLALMVVGALLELLGVGAIPAFISLLGQPEKALAHPLVSRVYEALGAESPTQFLLWATYGLVVLFIGKNLYLSSLTYLRARYVYRHQATIATAVFREYMNAPYVFHLQRNTAQLQRNVNAETGVLVNSFLVPLLQLAMEVVLTAMILGLLVLVEPLLSLATIVLLGSATALFYRGVRRKANRYGKEQQFHRGQMVQTVLEGLGGLRDARVLGREEYFLDAHRKSLAGYVRTSRFRDFAAELPGPFIETVGVVGLLAMTAVLLAQGRPLPMIMQTLALFGAAAIRLMPSFKRIMGAITSLRFNHHSVDLLYQEVRGGATGAVGSEPAKDPRAVAPERCAGEDGIVLDGVSFRYPLAERDAVDNVSVRIPRGTAVAFVGSSGAGKTTLVDLILGLVAPTSGQIRVDGRGIHESLRSWQDTVGYVPQSIFLCDDTLRRNVAFGVPEEQIDDRAVWRAIEAAQLSEVVDDLPGGVHTVIGERGMRLSGGQRQRIGIARALYHDPRVLVMDEATSAVDNQTEDRITQAIAGLRGRMTVIVIAHRLSTVKDCDRIYLMESGRVVAEGNFESLLVGSVPFRALAQTEALPKAV